MKVIVNQLKVNYTVFHRVILIGVNNFKGSMHLLIINAYDDFFSTVLQFGCYSGPVETVERSFTELWAR